MTFNITKDWCLAMAALEGDAEIGAGKFAVDPIFDGDVVPESTHEEPSIAFGRFIRLMRRSWSLSLEKLAEDADIDIGELVGIEDDVHYEPEARTVSKLARFFNLPQSNLLQVAGLTAPRDPGLIEEAVRFAARSETVTELTPAERAALEAFVSVLSKKG